MQRETFSVDWSFVYPLNCSLRKLRAMLAAMAALWRGWDDFPWYLSRTLHRQMDRPPADWDHLHTLAWMRAHAAHALLNERFHNQTAVLQLMLDEQIQFVGIFRQLVVDQIHWCLVFTKQDRLPDCALWGANTPESAAVVAEKRQTFRDGIDCAVSEFVRIMNFASVVRNSAECIAGHPLRVWFRGASIPDAVDVAVRSSSEDGRIVLRPEENASARFLSRRLPVPLAEFLSDRAAAERLAPERDDGAGAVADGASDAPSPPEAQSGREITFQAFELASRLDEGARRKSPAHVAVLRMYCCDGYSVNRIARECGCSHGTVMNRKRDLEARLGMPLDTFREYSGIFDEAEKTVAYSKAKKINRRGLLG